MRETFRERCLPFLPNRPTWLKPLPQPASQQRQKFPSSRLPRPSHAILDLPALQLVPMVSSAWLNRQLGTAGRTSPLLENNPHHRTPRTKPQSSVFLRRCCDKGSVNAKDATRRMGCFSEASLNGKGSHELAVPTCRKSDRFFLLAHVLARSKTSQCLLTSRLVDITDLLY